MSDDLELARAWPYQRGFAAVGLFKPGDSSNVGGALRAAYVYGAQLVAIASPRGRAADGIKHAANTVRGWKHIPTLVADDLRELVPFDCIPIAVDLLDDAIALPDYQHPARAFYIFGPENGTLGRNITDWCAHRIMVPTRVCMNLAATVNVVLYDRIAKAMLSAKRERKVDVA